MRNTRRVAKLMTSVLAFLILALLLGCEQLFAPSATGNLEVRIMQSLDGARTLLPNMTVAKYTIKLDGPDSGSDPDITRNDVTGSSTSFTGLAAGSWSITVEAFNSGNAKIGEGTTTVNISRRTTASASVTVVPLSGNGSLDITLSWPSGSITSPAVETSLVPIGGGSAINPSSSSANSTGGSLIWTSNVPAGFYTLSVKVKDGSTVVAGKADSVRILSGLTTTGSYTWTVAQPGRLDLTINSELNNPLTVSITGNGITINNGQGTLNEGSTAILEASATGAQSFTWYVDGTQVHTGSSYTIGSGWAAGEYYQVDVIAADNASNPTRTGSATVGITVQ